MEALAGRALDYLAALASKLGGTAEYLWPSLVKYYVAMQIGVQIAVVLGFIICSSLLVFFLIGLLKEWFDEDGFIGTIGAFITGIAALVLFIATLVNAPYTIAAIYAPEAYTAVHLLQDATGKK